VRKLLLAALLCLGISLSARAQTHTFAPRDANNIFTGNNTFNGSTNLNLQSYTVATLPAAASTQIGFIVSVTDANVTGSCTTGGGTALSLCRNSGAAWVPIGSGFNPAIPGPIGGTTPAAGTFTTLNATSIPSPGPIGGTTPNTGTFTSITTSTIFDANGAPFITSAATASAVDSIKITNAATANPATVTIATSGTDSNINLSLAGKGAGGVVLAGISETLTTQTTTYTALPSDDTILCNGTFTTTLPVTGIPTGKKYAVKNIGTGLCTVAPASGNIDGSASFLVSSQYQATEFVFDGTQWWAL
jgi:hypothetical protein